MGCTHVEQKTCSLCEEKRKRWSILQSRYREKGKKDISSFRENLQKRTVKLFYSIHYWNNLNNREYTVHDVEQGLLYGKLIERNKFQNETTVSFVLLYYAEEKPMHIVVNKLDDENYLLVTVYNPQAHDWKWDATYQKRVCFCAND